MERVNELLLGTLESKLNENHCLLLLQGLEVYVAKIDSPEGLKSMRL